MKNKRDVLFHLSFEKVMVLSVADLEYLVIISVTFPFACVLSELPTSICLPFI